MSKMNEIGDSIEISDSDESDNSVIELSSDSDSGDDTNESSSELIFVDLRNRESIEVKDHAGPTATVEELARISEQFILSIDTEAVDKLLNYSNVTIRKRNRFPANSNTETDSPLSTFNPNQTENVSDLARSASIEPNIRSTKTFLESLNDYVPLELAHPESVKFKKNFKRHRNELVEKLMSLYDVEIFDSKLGHIPWTWTKWIGNFGGCFFQREEKGSISLNDVFLTSAERLRDTLLHEMCHAAVYIINKHSKIDDEDEGHGPLWQSWGQLAKNVFPEIPPIQRYAYYEMAQKYKYKCTICWGSSLSNSKMKTDNLFCALCHGPVQLFRIQRKNGKRVTVALRKPGSFALFVKENYKIIKKPEITHAGVMKLLSENYAKLTEQQKLKYRQSFGNLH